MSSNLTNEELRSFCAGVVLNGSTATYDANRIDMNKVHDAFPFGPDGIDCRLLVEPESPWPVHIQVVMTTIFLLLSIIGIIGNVLVITVVLRVKGMISPTNCYLTSLAISDTLFFLAATPTEISYLYTTDYVFGWAGCAVFTFLPFLAINLSALSITAFTFERYYGICRPYKARQHCTVERAKTLLKVIWITALVYNSPWLLLATVVTDEEGSRYCNFRLQRDSGFYKAMFAMDFTLFYLVPMLFNCVIYIKIYFVLASSGDKLKKAPVAHTGEPDDKNSASTEFHISGGRSRASTKGKNSVVKMLAVVVIVFATCWLPYRAMVMYNSFAETRWDPDWFIFFAKTLIFINCAINPILYNLMSQRFRSSFRSLLSGKRSSGFSPTMTNYSRTPTTMIVDKTGRTTTVTSSKEELKQLVQAETP